MCPNCGSIRILCFAAWLRVVSSIPVVVVCLQLGLPVGETLAADAPPQITYDDHILPIFRQKCLSCHNLDKKRGDLDLGNYTSLMQGGSSGEVVVPGDSDSSYLYLLVTHESEPAMPLDSPKIPAEMIEKIGQWIDGGLLENTGSTAQVSKKPKQSFALAAPSNERPEVVPMPPRLSLEPVSHTPGTTAVSALATNPWSPLLAVAGQRQVLLYDTQKSELIGILPFPEGVAEVLRFSRNGSLLLAGGGRGATSGQVVVWDVHTGERVFEIGDELDTVLAADISSDQTLIALGGPQRVVRVFSVESGEKLYEIRKHTDWICALEFSPNGVLLATADRNGGLFVWEGWTEREYLTLKGHSATVAGLSWRSDSNVLASGSEDGSIRLWEMENGGQIKKWDSHGGVASLQFTRDGRILTCGRDGHVRLWDQDAKQLSDVSGFGDLAVEVAFCNETDQMIAGDWTGAIRVWKAGDGQAMNELSANPPTLAERLDNAKQELSASEVEAQSAAETYRLATLAANEATANHLKAQESLRQLQQQKQTWQADVVTLKNKLDVAANDYEVAEKRAEVLIQAVPALAEAATQAETAAKALLDDAELLEATTRLRQSHRLRAEELAALEQSKPDRSQALSSFRDQVSATEQKIGALTTTISAAEQQQEATAQVAKSAGEKMAASQQTSELAGAARSKSQQHVTHWENEIAFVTQLNRLVAEHVTSRETVLERERGHAEAVAKVEVAKQAATAAQAALTEAEEELARIAREIAISKGIQEPAGSPGQAEQVSQVSE